MYINDFGLTLIQIGDSFKKCASIITEQDYEEFTLYPVISADSFVEAAKAGFMPMGISFLAPDGVKVDWLLPKLHRERCMLDPTKVKISKTAWREASAYALSFNVCFDSVLFNCVKTHGEDWLVPGLQRLMLQLNKEKHSVQLVSVELWDLANEAAMEPCAGELGYVIGSSYASLSAFRTISGSGTVQLSALGAFLALSGFTLWDLGMEMPYKLSMGGELFSRKEFLARLYKAYNDISTRFDENAVGLQNHIVDGFKKESKAYFYSARSLIDGFLSSNIKKYS